MVLNLFLSHLHFKNKLVEQTQTIKKIFNNNFIVYNIFISIFYIHFQVTIDQLYFFEKIILYFLVLQNILCQL